MSYLEAIKEKHIAEALPLTDESSPFLEHENGYTIMNYDEEIMAYIDVINDRYAEKGLDPDSFRSVLSYETYKRKANQASAFVLLLKEREKHGEDPVDIIENIIRLGRETAGIQVGDLIEAFVNQE